MHPNQLHSPIQNLQMVPIVEAYPEELETVHPEKNRFFFQPSKKLSVTPKIGKLPKIKIGKIKVNTTDAQPHVIPEVVKTLKSGIRMEITGTQKYHTRSITKRVNHVTTFKNVPEMFQEEATEKIKTHIGTYYFARIDTKE